jgi:hypothetical protein
MRCPVPAALLLAVAPGLQAASDTYYVSPAGSDASGNGSAANPWATLAQAAQKIPDDSSTVLALDGIYEICQTIGRRFEKVATFKAQHPYRARLRSAPPKHRAFYIYDACNVVVDGFEIEGAPATGEFPVHIGTANAHHIVFQNNVIHDSYDNDLVMQYGALKPGSPAIDAADPANMPEDDILERRRLKGKKPDIGAFELEAGARR